MTSPDEAGGSPPATLTPTGWEPPVPEGAPTPATPRLPAGLHATLQGHLAPGATPAYVHQDVLTEIARHGRNALGRAGGLLLGSRHGVGPEGWIEVDGFAAAGPVESNTLLAARLQAALLDESTIDLEKVVGWFYCRPAPGPRPTPQELRLHRTLFPAQDWPLLLLVETRRARLTLFQLRDETAQGTGFFLLNEAR